MNSRQFDKLGKYIRWIANEMGLRDWVFTLMSTPLSKQADGDTAAMIHIIWGRENASITLADDFNLYDGESQRHYIVHELVHPILDGMKQIVENDLADCLADSTRNFARQVMLRENERATDRLATIIAKGMPLP